MTIFVKSFNRKTLSLDVGVGDTVEDVTSKILFVAIFEFLCVENDVLLVVVRDSTVALAAIMGQHRSI